MTKTFYNTDGPQCPYCGNVETPDEQFYYDPDTTTIQCGNCEKVYRVEVQHETTWA